MAGSRLTLDSVGLKTFLSLLILLGATGAQAQSLEVLGPSGAVPPDGFPVAVVLRGADGQAQPGRPRVTVEGADHRPGTPQPPLTTLWITPRPSAREVRLRAVQGSLTAEARFPVGPPAARVELSIDPPAPVKGRDTRAELSIRVLHADGSPDPDASPPVLRSNVGAVTGLTRVGPGLFRAVYELPSTRYPEVAIIVALSPWPHPQSIYGALGRLLVPLSGAVELPGRTEPNARTTVEIAGVTFGPVLAGPDGRFKLPVVVPPGHRYGTGIAVDRVGNRRRRKVDLALPPTDQLACVANPTRLPADGASQARIFCAASDPFGRPVASNKVRLSAERGRLSEPRVLENGMLEWIYTAPAALPGEPETLLATWRQAGPLSREELKLELVQGPAARLELSVKERVVFAGGALPITATVTDSLGRPRAGARLLLDASAGTFPAQEERAPGRLSTTWEVPGELRGPITLRARALGPPGSDPARIVAWIEAGELRAAVTDLAGMPVPRQRLRMDGREIVTDDHGLVALGPARPGRVAIVHGQWPGLRLDLYVLEDGREMFPSGVAPWTPERQETVTVAPPARVVVRFNLRPGALAWWLEDDRGRRLQGRRVEVAVSNEAGSVQAVSGSAPATIALRGREPVTVTVTDVETGSAGVAEVRP